MDVARLDAMRVHASLPTLGARREPRFNCAYLFARDRIVLQREIHQLLEAAQRIQLGKLGDPVLGENECGEVRDARAQVGLDVRNAVLSEEKCTEAGLQREVAQLCYVVVGEVDRIVVACGSHVLNGRDLVACNSHILISTQLFKCSICSFHTHLVNRVHAP